MGLSDPLILLDLSIRVIASIVLGAAIGLERQWRLRATGIRTNALVSVGAALFVILGAVGFNAPVADPTRVAAQVVSGIGFLGAGVIIRNGLNIRGLATAATLWCAAAVGSLAGGGMIWMAIIGTAGVIACNTLLRPLSRLINRRVGGGVDAYEPDPESRRIELDVETARDYILEAVTSEKGEPRIRALLMQSAATPELSLRSLVVRPRKHSEVAIVAQFTGAGGDEFGLLEHAVQRLSMDPKVSKASWWVADDSDD
ncbi:MgtC/SapB family protein [Microbacterium forte]|uniref:MgtC/SapB family protein n=1 Tax=Microbacterium forte TaxID=2982533 RepID=UPI002892EE7C|nr:MgtC/SapB family protein [Microbacterium sp. A(2022)]